MRRHIRSWDSKISFFVFADIITGVSGILIFVTLLLATDLGRPNSGAGASGDPQTQEKLRGVLAEQVDINAQCQRLQSLLTTAETAPAKEKLDADIVRLRSQLADENTKHSGMSELLAANQAAREARDRTLGLTDLKANIEHILEEGDALVREDTKARDTMTALEQRVSSLEAKLLKLREREGKLWLVPDRSSTTKEPILTIVSGKGARVERFDHPDQAREFNKSNARAEFDSYLGDAKPLDQYIVFLVRPSGIELFERLVKSAREKGFEVGFDALEEGREIHFSTPPPVEETPVPPRSSASIPTSEPAASTNTRAIPTGAEPAAASATNAVTPAAATSKPSAPAPRPKSRWQRFLEFISGG